MILYLDTSALVPLLIQEPSSGACGELWNAADKVITSRIAYIQAVAALGMAQRLKRLSAHSLGRARALLDELWQEVDLIEIDQALMSAAAHAAIAHGLRGYDATHCAAALMANDGQLVFASGDGKLLSALQDEGVAVRNTLDLT